MSLMVNLKHLENKNLHLKGELPFEEFELEKVDELIHLTHPLIYDLEVQKTACNLLLQGSLKIILSCECARCLNRYDHLLSLDPWVGYVPLEGEDTAPVMNDCVDLTPYIREDIVLAFPQQPLCGTECQGAKELKRKIQSGTKSGGGEDESDSTWSELDKLQF